MAVKYYIKMCNCNLVRQVPTISHFVLGFSFLEAEMDALVHHKLLCSSNLLRINS